MGNKFLTITILVLVLVGLTLGYFIYQGSISNKEGQNMEPEISNTINNEAEPTDSTGTSQATPTPNPNKEAILKFPDENASAEEKSKHADLISESAVRADYLNLTNCQADPLVFAVDKGKAITAKNDGEIAISINTGGNDLTIEKKSQIQINTDSFFGGTVGDHGYGCSEVKGIAGIVKIMGQ